MNHAPSSVKKANRPRLTLAKRSLLAVYTMAILGGCSVIMPSFEPDPVPGIQLKDLRPLSDISTTDIATAPGGEASNSESNEATTIAIDAVIQQHTDTLTFIGDQPTTTALKLELADLLMRRGEERLANAEDDETVAAANNDFQTAITHYESILQQLNTAPPTTQTDTTLSSKPSFTAQEDLLLYQLGKAYDFLGDKDQAYVLQKRLTTDYPTSAVAAESFFRMGEYHYIRKDYRAARVAYNALVADYPESELIQNARYMKGWSLFKETKLPQAARSFNELLAAYFDTQIPLTPLLYSTLKTDASEPVDMTQLSDVTPLEYKDNNALIEDTLRALTLIFSHQGGYHGLETLFSALPAASHPNYRPMLHARLANHLLTKERITDAIDVYQKYVESFPLSQWSPQFQLEIIRLANSKRFIQQSYQQKIAFSEAYDPESEYWKEEKNLEIQPLVANYLGAFQLEIAGVHHATAQRKSTAINDRETAYLTAAQWYARYLTSYPTADDYRDILFNKANALFQAKQYAAAINDYTQLAYSKQASDTPESDKHETEVSSNEVNIKEASGYSIILSQQALLALNPNNLEVKDSLLSSQLMFIEAFPQDDRTPALTIKSADELFARQQYDKVVSFVQPYLANTATVSPQDKQHLLELIAHSYFEQGLYKDAEPAYTAVLNTYPKPVLKADKAKVTELEALYATAIYKQAEAAFDNDQLDTAIEDWKRLITTAPQSTLAPRALHDIATVHLSNKAWDLAITALTQFRQTYPKHELNKEIPAKLAIAYQENNQSAEAAAEFLAVRQTKTDPNEINALTLLIAQLYEQSGNTENAITHYRTYANNAITNKVVLIEIQLKLATLYGTVREAAKRDFWLEKIISTHNALPSEQQPQTVEYAAEAASEFASRAFSYFKSIQLTLPLERSFPRKQKAMETAINHFERLIALDSFDHTTQSYYYMGEIYRELGSAIMASDRPAELNELELEEYEILLEEQAYPFEDQAVEIHKSNSEYSWDGYYNEWVGRSFQTLSELQPATYDKPELLLDQSPYLH